MEQTKPEAQSPKPLEWDAPFYIVGVGASAGGLEALEKFFDNMRPDSGLAFVVIQHLSPDFKSLMDELLRRHTDIAIHRVEDGMEVEPNSIYLIPPKKEMIISGGRLLLTDKDPTQGLSLRIERRLMLNQTLDLDAYAERSSYDPEELSALYKDLLIGVTKFFRDREAFDRLEKEVVSNLLSRKRPEEEIRVWVAGCATGEEAYSVAMVLHAHFEAVGRQQNIKIFATDVHRASLEFATVGIYAGASLSEVPLTRLERYFHRHGNAFQVVPELRRMIVFAPHHVIEDAPFTKMDLITCRNLLIYLSAPAQKKVLSLFLFGLKTRGILFLGPSESPGDLASEFDTLDNQWKLYRKRRDVGLPADMRFPLSSGFIAPGSSAARASAELPRPKDSTLTRIYDVLLRKHMPPSLLVNERQELVHSFGHAGRYLVILQATIEELETSNEEMQATNEELVASNEELVGQSMIAKDIKRLKDAEREAREAVRRRDHFLAMLSHELRNPLAAVMNASRLLDRVADGNLQQIREACQVIQRQGGQMTRLLDDLLDVSRVAQGKIRLRQSVCDITRMVDDAVDVVRSRIEQRQQELLVEIQHRPLYVRGDCSRLLQIQVNLLSNAAKYTPIGGKVWLNLQRDGAEAVLRVRDNGRGIPASMLRNIFDLFVQTDDPTHADQGGMGVGLTLVQQLVELHGGTVQALSEHRPDVALVDLRLPVVDGYEVARRARADDRYRGVRLIALTGYGRTQDRQAVLEAGFDEHLVKPVDADELSRALIHGVS